MHLQFPPDVIFTFFYFFHWDENFMMLHKNINWWNHFCNLFAQYTIKFWFSLIFHQHEQFSINENFSLHQTSSIAIEMKWFRFVAVMFHHLHTRYVLNVQMRKLINFQKWFMRREAKFKINWRQLYNILLFPSILLFFEYIQILLFSSKFKIRKRERAKQRIHVIKFF